MISPILPNRDRRIRPRCAAGYVPPPDHHPQSLVCPFCSAFRGYGPCRRCGCAVNEDGTCRVCGTDYRGIGGGT
jgi:hypothetical protein